MIIVDASVVIKVFFPEEGSERARALAESEAMLAPDLLLMEFANYLQKQRGLELGERRMLLGEMMRLAIEYFVLPKESYIHVIDLAYRFSLSAYDASYIVLAKNLDVPFITADSKLFQKTKKLGFVKNL